MSTDHLLRLAFDAVSARPAEMPPGLEAATLARAQDSGARRRHDGWSPPAPSAITSLTAFLRTAAEVGELLDGLGPDDWRATTAVEDATVRGLVEHMVGVERYVLGCLDRRPRLEAPRRQDHWPVSQEAAAGVSEESDRSLVQIWWSEVLALVEACAELGPDAPVAYHHLAGSLQGMLVVRTFELWTHGDDIRRATGRPLDELDEERLSLMVSELMRVLPFGLALEGCSQSGRTARFDLSGPGGGIFDVSLDVDAVPAPPPPGPNGATAVPDITVTAVAVDLCRLAANRLAWDAFEVHVDGDRSLLEPVLVGAAAFAAD
jgi:uncharacterized protein (TIGR03083 family)